MVPGASVFSPAHEESSTALPTLCDHSVCDANEARGVCGYFKQRHIFLLLHFSLMVEGCVCGYEEKLNVVAVCVSVHLSVHFSLHREENVSSQRF